MKQENTLRIRWAGHEPGSGYEIQNGNGWEPIERSEITRLQEQGAAVIWNPQK